MADGVERDGAAWLLGAGGEIVAAGGDRGPKRVGDGGEVGDAGLDVDQLGRGPFPQARPLTSTAGTVAMSGGVQ